MKVLYSLSPKESTDSSPNEGEKLTPATLNSKGKKKSFSGLAQKQPGDTVPSTCFLCDSVASLHGSGNFPVS